MSERALLANAPRRTAGPVVLAGQCAFAFFLAICVALHPGLVLKANEGGMSNYGVHAKTFALYSLALVLPAWFSWRASVLLGARASRLRTLLRIYALLLVVTLLSTYPYTLNHVWRDVHVGMGVVVAIFQVGAALWLWRQLRRFATALIVEFVGLVLAALTITGMLHVLFLSQVVSGGAFAVLLVARSWRERPRAEVVDA